jgi:predicted DNA-binding protein YlxM (UPF0122 family)
MNPLYEKTQEELNALNISLNEKKRNINIEREVAKNALRVVEKKLSEVEDNLNRILREFKRREDISESKTMIGEKEKNIDGFNLLSEDELSVIAKNMNKTDYRKYGQYPRWLDLENIIETVVEMKKRYPKFTLTNLDIGGQIDVLPPQTFYRYEFTDEYDCTFKT